MHEALNDIAGDKQGINRKILGQWIKRNANRVVDGMRFVRATGSRSAAAWKSGIGFVGFIGFLTLERKSVKWKK